MRSKGRRPIHNFLALNFFFSPCMDHIVNVYIKKNAVAVIGDIDGNVMFSYAYLLFKKIVLL